MLPLGYSYQGKLSVLFRIATKWEQTQRLADPSGVFTTNLHNADKISIIVHILLTFQMLSLWVILAHSYVFIVCAVHHYFCRRPMSWGFPSLLILHFRGCCVVFYIPELLIVAHIFCICTNTIIMGRALGRAPRNSQPGWPRANRGP